MNKRHIYVIIVDKKRNQKDSGVEKRWSYFCPFSKPSYPVSLIPVRRVAATLPLQHCREQEVTLMPQHRPAVVIYHLTPLN